MLVNSSTCFEFHGQIFDRSSLLLSQYFSVTISNKWNKTLVTSDIRPYVRNILDLNFYQISLILAWSLMFYSWTIHYISIHSIHHVLIKSAFKILERSYLFQRKTLWYQTGVSECQHLTWLWKNYFIKVIKSFREGGGIGRLSRQFFTQKETSLLLVKWCKFWPILVAIELWGSFTVSDLQVLWHGASVYKVICKDPWHSHMLPSVNQSVD